MEARECRGEGRTAVATHGIAGAGGPMLRILHASAGLADYREREGELFPSDTNDGIASAADAGAGGSDGALDGIPNVVSTGASSTAYVTLTAAAAAGGVGSASGIASTPSLSPGATAAVEPRRGEDSDNLDPPEQIVDILNTC